MTEEEKKSIEYYSDKEVSFSVDFDTEKLLKSLGITEEDSFENHQIRIKTLLNLITRLKKENEKKDKRLNRQFKLLNKKDKQIEQALKIAFDYGQVDGGHHKAWVIDQMVRALTGKKYDKWINDYIYDEETGDSYTWDKGIAP